MSRCFPFPPPGYEKKAVTDGADLLKKEKQREKKHKKEKRDKEKKDREKKESKEKREKEGRDGKHKEKKDKKEKHREKKKDKDKDRDKDKNKHNTADEKGFPGQAEGPNADKVNQKELKQADKKNILSGEKFTKHFVGREKARENNHLAEENKDSKFLKELGRRIRDEDTGTGNQLVQMFTSADYKKDEGTVRLVAKGSCTLPDGKEKLKDKTLGARKLDWQGLRTESRPSGNATVQNETGIFHPRGDGMPGPLEKNFNRSTGATMERQEKFKEKKADDKRGDKRKDRDKEKKGHGKDKDRDKEKKKEEKAKELTQHKSAEHSRLKESNKGGLVGTNSFTQVPGDSHSTEHSKLKGSNKGSLIGTNSFAQITRDSHENAVSGENLKKRKDIESNGVLHANDHWPSKMPRPSSSSHPFTENGRILDPFEISIPHASDRQEGAAKLKVDGKERKINGIIEARPSAVSLNKTNTVTVPVDPDRETPAKPPHPDFKYLSKVYSIPKIEEWSGVDDQDWLFGSSSQESKPMAESSEVGETLQVWAEAVHIEPADIYALPYVIPY